MERKLLTAAAAPNDGSSIPRDFLSIRSLVLDRYGASLYLEEGVIMSRNTPKRTNSASPAAGAVDTLNPNSSFKSKAESQLFIVEQKTRLHQYFKEALDISVMINEDGEVAYGKESMNHGG